MEKGQLLVSPSTFSTNGTEPTMITIILGVLTVALIIIIILFLYQRRVFSRILQVEIIDRLLRQSELDLVHAVLSSKDKEIGKIFSELHDTLGSILVALNMYADSLASRSDQQSHKEISHKISDASKQASEMVRKISSALDSGLIKHFNLESGVNKLLEAVEEKREINTKLNIHLDQKLSNERAFQVYKMVQELVRNSLQHSGCTQIHLDIQSNDEITIIYEDNGVGFDHSVKYVGQGLKNLETQVEELNGELKIDSKSERGSTFIIELPT